MILEILLTVLVAVTALAGWKMSALALARGRREAELVAAATTEPLRQHAGELASRLAAAETRVENAEKTFREMQGQRGALEATAGRVPVLEGEIKALAARAESLSRELAESGNRSAGLEASLREVREREPQVREALQRELAQFLDEKGKSFSKQNSESMETILAPLRTRLHEFEKKVDDTHKEGRDQHVQLRTQIEGLLGMNQQLTLEAQNLSTALKGENKTSGNWGEIVLERVLEMSGLEKGREYEVQQAYANDDGKRKLPDAVVHLPDKRNLVIDSKLSLVAYERYCSAQTPEAGAMELQAHIASVRQHVKNLAEQRYQDLPGLRTPDFVFLFMPVEPAFILAVKQDSSLFQEAFNRNIIIVSPSTLLATLRTVENIWKQEYRHANVDEIAKLAGDLYDKFVGFLEDLDGIGDGLSKAQGRFEEARKKLKEGKGNLVGRIEKIRIKGAKAKKQIPSSWRDSDADDDAAEAAEDAVGEPPALPPDEAG